MMSTTQVSNQGNEQFQLWNDSMNETNEAEFESLLDSIMLYASTVLEEGESEPEPSPKGRNIVPSVPEGGLPVYVHSEPDDPIPVIHDSKGIEADAPERKPHLPGLPIPVHPDIAAKLNEERGRINLTPTLERETPGREIPTVDTPPILTLDTNKGEKKPVVADSPPILPIDTNNGEKKPDASIDAPVREPMTISTEPTPPGGGVLERSPLDEVSPRRESSPVTTHDAPVREPMTVSTEPTPPDGGVFERSPLDEVEPIREFRAPPTLENPRSQLSRPKTDSVSISSIDSEAIPMPEGDLDMKRSDEKLKMIENSDIDVEVIQNKPVENLVKETSKTPGSNPVLESASLWNNIPRLQRRTNGTGQSFNSTVKQEVAPSESLNSAAFDNAPVAAKQVAPAFNNSEVTPQNQTFTAAPSSSPKPNVDGTKQTEGDVSGEQDSLLVDDGGSNLESLTSDQVDAEATGLQRGFESPAVKPKEGPVEFKVSKVEPTFGDKILDRFSTEFETQNDFRFRESKATSPAKQIAEQFSLEFEPPVQTGDSKSIKVKLNPEELGEVELTITKNDEGLLDITIEVESEFVMKSISEGIEALKASITDSGGEVGTLDISEFGSKDDEKKEQKEQSEFSKQRMETQTL